MSENIPLGDRMKGQYEHRCRVMLPRRTYTIIRIDGKAFHTYTRGAERPYDQGIMDAMDAATVALCEELQGVRFAYTQSDEISILLTDFETITSDAWFDGNVQKIVSVSASAATAAFGRNHDNGRIALFDSRVFTIPDPVEVENYFVWRQQDATRNAVLMLAQAHFSHKEMLKVSCDQLQEMLWSQKGINFNDQPAGFKRGRAIVKEAYEREGATRTRWVAEAPPIFTKDRHYLTSRVPRIGDAPPESVESQLLGNPPSNAVRSETEEGERL